MDIVETLFASCVSRLFQDFKAWMEGLMQMSQENQQTESQFTTATRQSEIVIADVCRLNGESIAWCLNAYGSFRSVTSVSSAEGLAAAIKEQRPGVALIGEGIVADGLREISGQLAIRLGETRLAVFADRLTDRQLDLVIHNRVTGLLSRQDSMRVINDQLVRLTGGAKVVSPGLSDRVQLTDDGEFECLASSHLQKLTDRQWDVLLRIAEGRRVAEVAHDLHISEKAVESHKYRIMKTIGASDRVDLCRWAIREGFIQA